MNRLSSVTSGDESVTYTYDDNSNLLQTVKADGSIESYTYNNANQLTQKIREINGITLESYLYTYYLNGNIRTHNETLPDTVNHTYTYDGMGRLINETVSGDYIRNDTYTYDRRGNRTGLVSLDGTTSYVYNKSNQLLSKTKTTSSGTQSNVYSYDNFGNRVQNILSENGEIFDTVTYQYDAFNRLDRIYTSTGYNQTYTYDGDNLRQTITDNNYATIEEIYDNGNIIGRKQGVNTYGYVYGLEHEWYFSDSESGIYSKNYRGDVSKEIQPNGTEKTRAYSAYGDSIMSSYAGVSPFGYAGEVTDTSGLIYLRNRYYDPETGTFLTLDPIKDGLNWYAYANNNPLKYIDPSGLRSKEAADKIIKDNATYIISAAEEFGVNPGILAATIYAEQRLNVDWKDDYIDGIFGFYGVDTSIGIGQLRISTAKFIEKEEYMPTLSAKDGGWNIPLIGFVHGTEQMVREKTLENSELNIKYAAGYLKYFQDEWKNVYPDIDGKTDILATLYNLGHEQTSPNSNPKPNDFGKFAKENYSHVRKLLGLE